MALRALCLCDGYGGFELGLKLAVGSDGIRTVARVERDSYAAATLVARMEEQTLDRAPIWDDLTTFGGTAWCGRVDLITAGFPCQPFSAAGQRRGVDDERWLWPDIARIVADVGPRYVFLENVPGLVRHGLPHVLADLADLGFDAEWGLLSAADVGAPHKRQRFWLLAVTDDDDGHLRLGRQSEHDRDARRDVDGSGGPHVADANGTRREGRERSPKRGNPQLPQPQHASGPHVADAASVDEREPHDGSRPQPRQWSRPDTGRGSIGAFPPRPDDHAGWERWRAESGPEPSVRRSTDGRPVGLADALHLGGNGLVPLAAAHAFRSLLARIEDR